MHTDDFIRALAVDDVKPRIAPVFALALAAAVGTIVSSALFMVLLGPRPDVADAVAQPRFMLKFVETLALAAAAAAALLRLARPGARVAPVAALLVLAPAILAAAIVFELVVVPSAQWEPRLVGSNALVCLTFIPLLSLPLLPAVLLALRIGAPTHTAVAGAVAGLLSAALAASLYAAHCTDDSPLFVATWYTLAVAIVVAVGAVVGRRVLRW